MLSLTIRPGGVVAPPSGTPSSDVLARAQAVGSKLRTYGEVDLIETTVPSDTDTGMSALAAAFTDDGVLEASGPYAGLGSAEARHELDETLKGIVLCCLLVH